MSSMMAIYDTMQHIKPEVMTACIGMAASAAAVILAAGAPGKRYVLPHARVLIHQPHPMGGGLKARHRYRDSRPGDRPAERGDELILARHTGQTVETVPETPIVTAR